jgi:preprotein translocase subunit SecY
MVVDIKNIVSNIPEVSKPSEKKLDFNTKLKWTVIMLVCFFVLANVPLFALTANSLERFEFLQVILATEFGSLISLGIGPIVMSSIILQLLVGAGILAIDTKTPEGKKYFQGIQKIGVLFFILFEAIIYVSMGGLQAAPGLAWIVIFQLILGGLAIMLMDDVCHKWGFGSGVSLFIVAGVAWRLFTGLFQFMGPAGENCLLDFSNTACVGNVLIILQSVINGTPSEAIIAGVTILSTILIFLIVVWAQSLKVEIPLTYEKIRGYSMKWPLAFFYASNIPVILVAALAANIQLFGSLFETWLGHPTFLGGFSNTGQAISGLAYWISSSRLLEDIIRGSFQTSQIYQAIIHLSFYMTLSAIFAVFWVKTSGMDESSQAKNILASGLQIPGFRKDQRVLESILKRYILPLTIMGGLAVGALAGFADIIGALTGGTSILLAVMIMYQLYQNIAKQHAVDMHPAMKNLIN